MKLAPCVPALLILLVSISSGGECTVFEGGISNLGGVELQEEFYVSLAKERGEEAIKRQPLMSENDRFWAQVEPVPHKRQLKEQRSTRKFGPQLIDSRSRRMLLGSNEHLQN